MTAQQNAICVMADFTGLELAGGKLHRFPDYVEHDQLVSGNLWVHQNISKGTRTGTTFTPTGVNWGPTPAGTTEVGSDWEWFIGDFDGDNLADYAEHSFSANKFWVHRNLGFSSGFVKIGDPSPEMVGFTQAGTQTLVADFNGDGLVDIADHNLSNGNFVVRLNHGVTAGFDPVSNPTSEVGQTASGPGWKLLVGAFLGDNNAAGTGKLVDFMDISSAGQYWIHKNYGTRFDPQWVDSGTGWLSNFGSTFELLVGDLDADGFADIVSHDTSNGAFWVQWNRGDGTFAPPTALQSSSQANASEWSLLGGPLDACGDGVCSAGEWGVCTPDCGINIH